MSQKHILFLNYSNGTPDSLETILTDAGFTVHFIAPRALGADTDITLVPGIIPEIMIVLSDPSVQAVEDDIKFVTDFYKLHDFPVLALLQSTLPIEVDSIDSVLISPLYPSQVLARTRCLIRLQAMQLELSLRLKTLAEDFNLTTKFPKPIQKSRFNILFVGKASPDFMIIVNALQARNVNVVAAFTSFTAFEYLYEQEFDAVVINGMGTLEPAQSIIKTMRKNAKLYHVPTLMVVDGPSFKDHDLIFKAGLNDMLDIQADLSEISARVIEQANFHRMHENVKSFYSQLGGGTCVDRETNLGNRRFFDAHIARLSAFTVEKDKPLALALIRVTPSLKSPLSQIVKKDIYRQVGLTLKTLLRLQDFVARLDENIFAIAFPGQTPKNVSNVLERISEVLDAAHFVNFETSEPMHFEFEITLVDLMDEIKIEDVA